MYQIGGEYALKKLKVARYGYLLISLLFCLSAFAYWLIPARSPTVTCRVSGGILIAYGVIRILGFFSEDLYCLAFRYDLACGLLLIALGVVVWIKGDGSYPYLAPGLGWIALLDSFLKIQMSKEAKDFGLPQWKILLLMAVLTALSSFLLIINGFPGPQATDILTGCTLLLEGILNWFTVIFTVKQCRKKGSAEEEFS